MHQVIIYIGHAPTHSIWITTSLYKSLYPTPILIQITYIPDPLNKDIDTTCILTLGQTPLYTDPRPEPPAFSPQTRPPNKNPDKTTPVYKPKSRLLHFINHSFLQIVTLSSEGDLWNSKWHNSWHGNLLAGMDTSEAGNLVIECGKIKSH